MLSSIIFCFVGLIGGGCITLLFSRYYYRKGRDREIAMYVVGAMLHRHPVSDSKELEQRVDEYLDALNKTKKDKRGVPIYRDDGSIGVDWSIELRDKMSGSSRLSGELRKKGRYDD